MNENEDEVLNTFHLKILVEGDLYKRVTAITEGTKIKDIKKARETLIENFLNNLPDRFKKVPNYEKVVRDTLARTEENIKKLNQRER